MRTALGRTLATLVVFALAAANGAIQYGYVSRSASTNRLHGVMLDRLARLQTIAPTGPVMLDVPEVGKDNLVGLYARGRPAVVYDIFPMPVPGRNEALLEELSGRNVEVGNAARAIVNAYHHHHFDLAPDSGLSHEFMRFEFAEPAGVGPRTLVTMAADQSILNNSAERPAIGQYYVRALGDVENHLALVGSTLGHKMIPGVIDPVALWQWEPDPINVGAGIQAMGRHLLLEVLNPVPRSRILMDLTTGPLGEAEVDLSHAAVYGEGRTEFGFASRGATRMLSDPIAPRTIEGHHYIAIDMGTEPRRIPYERHGISALYNGNLNFDPRRIVGFARNISLLTEEQANALTAPMAIAHIPADLFAPGLLFSGIYEDGWIAEAAKFRLGSDQPTSSIRIAAQTPGVDPRLSGAVLEVLVDGRSVVQRRLRPGDFDLRVAIPPAAGARWIELRVDRTARLTPPDHRVASILLKSIALEGGE